MEAGVLIKPQECLEALFSANVDDATGLKYIPQDIYTGICKDASRGMEFQGGRFYFSKSCIYTPLSSHEDSLGAGGNQSPYCPNNEPNWTIYYNEKGTEIISHNTIVCNLLSDSTDHLIDMTPYFRANVLFKDPHHISHGEPTGFVLGYITTPLIVAIAEDRSLLYLAHYSKKFSDELDRIFPTTYVGLVRESTLDDTMNANLSSLIR